MFAVDLFHQGANDQVADAVQETGDQKNGSNHTCAKSCNICEEIGEEGVDWCVHHVVCEITDAVADTFFHMQGTVFAFICIFCAFYFVYLRTFS